jgi:hypothetical protein
VKPQVVPALPGTCSRVTVEGRLQGRVAPDPRCRGTASVSMAGVGEMRAHALSRLPSSREGKGSGNLPVREGKKGG